MTVLISLIAIGSLMLFVAGRKIINYISHKRAVQRLSTLLFPHGGHQKEQTLKKLDSLTHHRFKREDALDYFLKIKGLQTINLNDPVDFWTRHYLLQPTRIRLNYFEQVKFYETFLNYPEIQGKQELKPTNPIKKADPALVHEYA